MISEVEFKRENLIRVLQGKKTRRTHYTIVADYLTGEIEELSPILHTEGDMLVAVCPTFLPVSEEEEATTPKERALEEWEKKNSSKLHKFLEEQRLLFADERYSELWAEKVEKNLEKFRSRKVKEYSKPQEPSKLSQRGLTERECYKIISEEFESKQQQLKTAKAELNRSTKNK